MKQNITANKLNQLIREILFFSRIVTARKTYSNYTSQRFKRNSAYFGFINIIICHNMTRVLWNSTFMKLKSKFLSQYFKKIRVLTTKV